MTRLVRAELAKLRTTGVLAVSAVAVVAVTIAYLGMQLNNAGKVGAPSLGTVDSLRGMLLVVATAMQIVLIVGVLAVTSELRHVTMPTSVLAVPNRGALVAAKAGALALVGVAVAAGGVALELAIVVPYLLAAGVPIDVANGDLLLSVAGVLIGIPLFAVAGVGIGAIVRHQTVAVGAPLVWLLVIEQSLYSFGLARLVPWLPGGASGALARADATGLLPMWEGGLLAAAYVAAFVLGGMARFARQDL